LCFYNWQSYISRCIVLGRDGNYKLKGLTKDDLSELAVAQNSIKDWASRELDLGGFLQSYQCGACITAGEEFANEHLKSKIQLRSLLVFFAPTSTDTAVSEEEGEGGQEWDEERSMGAEEGEHESRNEFFEEVSMDAPEDEEALSVPPSPSGSPPPREIQEPYTVLSDTGSDDEDNYDTPAFDGSGMFQGSGDEGGGRGSGGSDGKGGGGNAPLRPPREPPQQHPPGAGGANVEDDEEEDDSAADAARHDAEAAEGDSAADAGSATPLRNRAGLTSSEVKEQLREIGAAMFAAINEEDLENMLEMETVNTVSTIFTHNIVYARPYNKKECARAGYPKVGLMVLRMECNRRTGAPSKAWKLEKCLDHLSENFTKLTKVAPTPNTPKVTNTPKAAEVKSSLKGRNFWAAGADAFRLVNVVVVADPQAFQDRHASKSRDALDKSKGERAESSFWTKVSQRFASLEEKPWDELYFEQYHGQLMLLLLLSANVCVCLMCCVYVCVCVCVGGGGAPANGVCTVFNCRFLFTKLRF
jgi:hypothetical protein